MKVKLNNLRPVIHHGIVRKINRRFKAGRNKITASFIEEINALLSTEE